MYGLKENLDLSFLKGREVIQVAIGIHQVTFAFDEGVTISVEGQFEYVSVSGSVEWQPGASHLACNAVGLLSSKVQTVNSQADGMIELCFSNGNRLVLRDVNRNHES
jgi:hypothetical protein